MRISVFDWHKKTPQPSRRVTENLSMTVFHRVCLFTKGWSLRIHSTQSLVSYWQWGHAKNLWAGAILQWIFHNLVHILPTFSTPRSWNVQILCAGRLMHGQIFSIFIFPSLPHCVYALISRVVANQLVSRLSTYIFHQVWLENMSSERTSCKPNGAFGSHMPRKR